MKPSWGTVRRFALATLLVVVACAGLRHGYTAQEYTGQLLRVPNGPGAERLAIEMDYDPTIRNFVRMHGDPDYILAQDRYNVQLIFIQDDRLVLFQRAGLQPKSKATVTDPIPDPIVSLFSKDDQGRLTEMRRSRSSDAGPR